MGGRSIGIVHPRSVASPVVRGGPRGIPAAELGGAREDACEVRKVVVAFAHAQPPEPRRAIPGQ
jgi:hypothetical protein